MPDGQLILIAGALLAAALAASLLAGRIRLPEAGLNDPIAVLLVVGFIDWIEKPGYGILDMAGLFVQQLGIGAAAGLGVGWLSVQGLRRINLATAGLYPVATIATAALAYGAAD